MLNEGSDKIKLRNSSLVKQAIALIRLNFTQSIPSVGETQDSLLCPRSVHVIILRITCLTVEFEMACWDSVVSSLGVLSRAKEFEEE